MCTCNSMISKDHANVQFFCCLTELLFPYVLQIHSDLDQHCSVDTEPMSGKVDPGQSVTVSVVSTWTHVVSIVTLPFHCAFCQYHFRPGVLSSTFEM